MSDTFTLIRVRDLPEVTGRRLPSGAYIEPIRPILFCPSCGDEGSATPGDYWAFSPDHVFYCGDCDDPEGERAPLQLVRKRTVYEPWEER